MELGRDVRKGMYYTEITKRAAVADGGTQLRNR